MISHVRLTGVVGSWGHGVCLVENLVLKVSDTWGFTSTAYEITRSKEIECVCSIRCTSGGVEGLVDVCVAFDASLVE